MKVILLAVSSVDGRLTRWDESNIYAWTSKEDTNHFFDTIKENKLIVMGSKTFDVVKPRPEKERLRIVLTRTPEKYSSFALAGSLEFMHETPDILVARMEKLGYTQMILVGGSTLATSFFRKDLIDELWLTLEPRVFGNGLPLVEKTTFDISLRLMHVKQLNIQGTLLLKYSVRKKKFL